MVLTLHTEGSFKTGDRLGGAAEWSSLHVEHWHLEAGPRPDINFKSTVVALLLSGRPGIRRADDGQAQGFAARAGMAWVCPAGTQDRNIEFVSSMEVLHLCLPTPMLAHRLLADYEVDAAKVELAYAAGIADQTLLQIGMALMNVADRGFQPSDRLFVDGMQTALVGHLINTYSADRWCPEIQAPMLEAKRLARVLDFIQARLGDEFSLDDLAAEACLSAFHFSRLFREATGIPPYRYVTEQRVQAAKRKLCLLHSSLAEIALDTGFGSQANFTRVFRKSTGLTPGQYRNLQVG